MWWLLALGALTVGGILGNFLHHKRQKRWEKALVSCGFEVVWRADSRGMPHAFGIRSGSAAVRIEDLGGRIVVVAVPAQRSFSGVIVRHERYRPPEVPKLQTGDELFDSELWISGPEQLLHGLLDAETRRLLLGLDVKDSLEITRDEIRVETSDENLPSVLPLALDLGRRFARRANVARLSENARNDPEAGVRLQNLFLLIRDHPGESPTLMALSKACSDPAPEIRLRAALASGGARNGILVELAESLVADPVSAEAVSALDRELPFGRLRTILDHALDRRRAQTARACLEALGRSGDPAAVDVLAEAMARADGTTAAAAALALAATGSPAAEPPLLLALQREDTRVAAADALARAGTAAAVLPLEEAAERSPDDRDLRRATRQAIAEIQSRLQGASPGQLSLAEVQAGQLSLAQSDAGQLSLAADPAGQLSLAPDAPDMAAPPGGRRG